MRGICYSIAPLVGMVVLCSAPWAVGQDNVPLSPREARGKIGERVCVRMPVKEAKDRLDKRGELYLDSEIDFRDPKNFAVVINRAGAAGLRERHKIEDLAAYYGDQWIEATGTVEVVQEVPRINVTTADQIRRLPKTK